MDIPEKNGTYIQGHWRSSPDSDPTNNFSYPGNVNPYTGKIAPGNPETYLKDYPNYSNKPVFPVIIIVVVILYLGIIFCSNRRN